MIAGATVATDEQSRAWSQSMHDLQDQVAARRAVLMKDPPEWFSTLREQYAHHPRHDDVIDAVIVWRGVSDQTDSDTALGAEPPKDDYLRPYWIRMQTVMSAVEPAAQQPEAEPSVTQDVEAIEWDTLSADLDYQALDDATSPATITPNRHPHPPAPQTPSRTTTDWER